MKEFGILLPLFGLPVRIGLSGRRACASEAGARLRVRHFHRIVVNVRFSGKWGDCATNPGTFKAQSRLWRALLPFTLASLLAMALIAPAGAQGYRLSEDIIADPKTGAALLGFDPVEFFVANRAVPGSERLQTGFAGKAWYFANRANLAAFEANPQAYLPAFGGHDPVAVASGLAVIGSPAIHAIHEGRVYLFRRRENRDLFLARPDLVDEAERQWGEVRRQLVP